MWLYIMLGLAIGIVSNCLMSVFRARWLRRAADLKRDQAGKDLSVQYGLARRGDINQLFGARSWSLVGIALTLFLGAVLVLFLQPGEVVWFLISATVVQTLFWVRQVRRTAP